jgi:uncharacterized protein involved in outer membrane biogenesis
MRRSRRIFSWIGGVLIVLIAAVVIFIVTFDWNRARPYVNAKASEALGRSFAIRGDLALHWRRDTQHGDWFPGPVFSADDVAIDNPSWAREKQFAHLDRVEFRLALLPLFVHRVSVPMLQLSRPVIHLEKQGDKRNTWTFKPAASDGPPSNWTMDLREIGFDTGAISLRDPSDRIDVDVTVDPLGKPIAFADVMGKVATSAAGKAAAKKRAQDYAFGFKLGGSYNGARVSGSGKTGGVLALRTADAAFPLQADMHVGDVHIALAGSITDPTSPDGIDLQLRLGGDSMAHLYPLIGVTLPDTPPFETDGHLSGKLVEHANTFTYEGFNGRVGGSDIHGTLTYAQHEPRPKLS